MGQSIVFRAPFGIPGNLSRAPEKSIVESSSFDSALPFPGYGLPGKIVGDDFAPIAAAGDVVYGFLVRPFPTQGVNPSDPVGVSVPPTSGEADVLVFGYLNVVCNAGTPAQGGSVFVRVAAGAAGTPVGGIEAALVAGDTVQIPGAIFTGPADAQGNCEIRFNV